MLSHKLIRMIEEHWEAIASRVGNRIRHDPRLHHIRSLPDSELEDRAREIVRNLGHWISDTKDKQLVERYEWIGRHRFQESFPLHETVHALHLVKQGLFDFIREQGVGQTPVELYAEEELEHVVGNFFDELVYHMVHGYEGAVRKAAGMEIG